MGCRTLWDRWNGPGVPKCTTGDQYRFQNTDPLCPGFIIVFRKHNNILKLLSRGDLAVITSVTGCQKPCSYKKYTLIGEKRRSTVQSEYFAFSLWAVSNSTMVEREELIYPLTSLVAEFGGTLGLFLGFSFMTLWDHILLLGYVTMAFRMFKTIFWGTTNAELRD